MNSEQLQRIVEEVVCRLTRRAGRVATLSVAQLREANARALFCHYASLTILQVDLPLLEHVAHAASSNTAAVIVQDAMASGLRVHLSVQHRLLSAMPVKKLARLPLTFSDEQGKNVFLHPLTLLSHADVARHCGGVLVLRRQCVVTALAREAASQRNIQLIKQE
ncbi:microcompartment protein PduM [Pseudocitrobacter vendiensis]|uniref:Microcompartment protein PduM n=1 Tax=Pseudocitrobacter vendiensis TaxID=2488306 RepID=A0ABN8T8F4_9ENTR|nr:microcompartment protein PduM [Pseudocitrobacter vendiensis]CAH6636699.1 Microcompartment protein PduM [Pseudocitrobacter vendiensis]